MRFALPVMLAVLGNVLYHASQKLTPLQANPFLSVAASFATASLLALCVFALTRTASFGVELGRLSWTAVGLGVAVVVIESSFLIAYRLGWKIGVTSLVVTAGQTALLLPMGRLFFSERVSPAGWLGVLLSVVGLALISLAA
jgi:drug/metabolite transporter (DMT)-like permease